MKTKTSILNGEDLNLLTPYKMWYGHNLPYNQVREHYLQIFRHKVGDDKYVTVKQKIENSNRVASLFKKTVENRNMPSQIAIFNTIQVIPYFVFRFTNVNLLALGCLMVMDKWEREINTKYKFVSDKDLVDVTERIVAYCENVSRGTAV